MDGAKEKGLNTEILYDSLEKKITEETYKAIEDYNNCQMIAFEYSKLNTLKAKIKGIFYNIQLFLKSLIQKESKTEKIVVKHINKHNHNEIDDCVDYNSQTVKIPEKRINEEFLNNDKYVSNAKNNSGPIIFDYKEAQGYKITDHQTKEGKNIKQIEKYIDTPKIKGDKRDEEIEI